MTRAASPVQILGPRNSRAAYEVRDFLARNLVEFDWIALETEADCIRLTGRMLNDPQLPIVVLQDGVRLYAPTINDLANRLGWVNRPKLREYDLSIYGAGPAGLSAAVYAASEGLNVVLLERETVGGQAGYSSLIENYLGFPQGIAGADLAERARQQAVSFGAELLLMRAGTRGEFRDDRMHADLTDGTVMTARSNICATGVDWRRLGIPREADLIGLGLYYGAGTGEAADCVGEDVYVVGGGNSAGQAVMNLAKFARSVTMLVRGSDLSDTLSAYLATRITTQANVHIQLNTRVTQLHGADCLIGIQTENSLHHVRADVLTTRLFVCIGGAPDTSWAEGTPIERDRLGYLITGPDIDPRRMSESWPLERAPFYLETSVPGSFAAGDVRKNSVKRVAAAVGEGAMAVTFAHRFLAETS